VRLRVLLVVLVVVGAFGLGERGHDTSRADTPSGAQMRPEEQRAFELINKYRASLKLTQLQAVDELINEAQWYADDMARNDAFSHTHIDSQGRPIEQRFQDFGYLWQRPLAQASGTGAESPEEAFQQFKDSNAHDAIMRDPRMRALGVGTATATDTASRTFWVASFGPSTDPRGPQPETTASSVKKKAKPKAKAKSKKSSSKSKAGAAGR
jgi:uncharacterized protein YkwD